LLRGKDLQDAELQLATNTSKDPAPTDLQRAFVLESRHAAEKQKRIITGISIAGAIIMAALAVFGFMQAGMARTAQAKAEAESRRAVSSQLALEAKNVQAQYPQRAQLLGLEALQVNLDAGEPVLPIAEEALYAANAKVNGKGVSGFAREVSLLQITSDNQWLVTGSVYLGEFRVWNLNEIDKPGYVPAEAKFDLKDVTVKTLDEYTPAYATAYLSPQENWLVADLGSELRLWSIPKLKADANPIVFKYQGSVTFLDDYSLLERQTGQVVLRRFDPQKLT
jgi:hypothetical protein